MWEHPAWAATVACASSVSVPIHVDGARLFNAVAATNIEVSVWTRQTGSVYIDFTKGLGAPFGSVLTGGADFIDEAWRWKHRLGGGMRQAGMMAAGRLYALENNIARLVDDHQSALRLHECLAELGCIGSAPETNMVWFEPPSNGPGIKPRMSPFGRDSEPRH